MTWQQLVRERIQALGERNWVLIVDAAFPLQVAPGLEVMLAGQALPEVLKFVLEQVRESPHVRPVVWMSEELAYMPEDCAPGIEEVTRQIDDLLVMEEIEVSRGLQMDLTDRVRRAADQFRVLLLKTTTPFPYTSVFIELHCAYWDADREGALRRRMVEEGR